MKSGHIERNCCCLLVSRDAQMDDDLKVVEPKRLVSKEKTFYWVRNLSAAQVTHGSVPVLYGG